MNQSKDEWGPHGTEPVPEEQRPSPRYTKQDVANTMRRVWTEIGGLREAGQKEYAHQDNRPFRNFEDLGQEMGMPREKILWIYARKHLDGILAYINGHRSQREDVRGRINDLIVYACILRAMADESEGISTVIDVLKDDPMYDPKDVISRIRIDSKFVEIVFNEGDKNLTCHHALMRISRLENTAAEQDVVVIE